MYAEEEERVTPHDSGMGGIQNARETRGVILCRCAAEVYIRASIAVTRSSSSAYNHALLFLSRVPLCIMLLGLCVR